MGALAAAERNETIKQGLNTRVTHEAVFAYNSRELEVRGVSSVDDFTRIIRAHQAREQRKRMKAHEAACVAALRRRDIVNSQKSLVQNRPGNGIIPTMKTGATTLALMAAIHCGLCVFCAPVSASGSATPTAQKCSFECCGHEHLSGGAVVPNGIPQENPQKIMAAMRANPSITRNELAELIGMTPEGVKSAISSLKASGAIRLAAAQGHAGAKEKLEELGCAAPRSQEKSEELRQIERTTFINNAF